MLDALLCCARVVVDLSVSTSYVRRLTLSCPCGGGSISKYIVCWTPYFVVPVWWWIDQ